GSISGRLRREKAQLSIGACSYRRTGTHFAGTCARIGAMSGEASVRDPIGLVGVGLMGTAFAHRLRGAGLPVVGFDVEPARLDPLVAIGGEKAASVADVARRCAIILVVVFSADQADGVLGEIAAAAGADGRPRTVVLSLTCDPERTIALAQRATDAGL